MPIYYNTNLKSLSEKAIILLEHCIICPRKCGVNRLKGELGHCNTGKDAIVSSYYGPHFGEESELVGTNGSGTLFFGYCNLNCVFCQNYDISQLGNGNNVDTKELAEIMLKLQKMECHNINLVSPTHIVPQFLQALSIAKDKGLNLPIVYNSGGYDSVDTLKLLDGVIDIYMPDAKYGSSRPSAYSKDENLVSEYQEGRDSNEMGEKYSNVYPAPFDKVTEDKAKIRKSNSTQFDKRCGAGYFEINKSALKEMYRQVGDLVVNERGIAQRGLLVRHLVLPNRIAGSFEVLRFIAEEISKNTYVNIMDQYRPCYKADKFPELSRRITSQELQEVIDYAKNVGLHRI